MLQLDMKNTINQKIEVKNHVSQEELERRMRLMANLIIDRIFEDQKNNRLMFKPSSNQENGSKNVRVIQRENTT